MSAEPQQPNLLLALNNSAMYLGASIGSAAGGLVISRISLAALPWASAGIGATGLVALVALHGASKGGARFSSRQRVYPD
jgi:predicted MFS family arabinose efflux permease